VAVPGDKPGRATATERILDIALKETGIFARRTLDRRLARAGYSKKDVEQIVEREGFVKRFAAAAIARLATRSVPGALAVSGAIAAEALLGRRKSATRAEETPEAVEDRSD